MGGQKAQPAYKNLSSCPKEGQKKT